MSYTDPRALRDQAARLLATADAIEDGTWQFVVENQATPTQVAEHLGISVQAANNRLRKLYDRGLLDREKVKVEGGGRAFLYRLRLSMPDGDTDATLLPTDHQERLESDPEYRALWDAYWLARNPMVQAWRDAAPRPDCPGVGRPMPDGEGDRQVEKPWRVGRKVGNTIYVVGADRPFALMPTPELATHVVALHNAARAHE